ncbi:mandelate racemase/muconate lactonizing enzyme family protein, partial [Pararhodobacter sp.]|uniref:mandelate racemase/muconate lactonizing enzyme family protein n=1 Tax=Pararhodobacter sp. TaxID=2127056 RepID=UPI002FE2F6B1
MRLIRLETFHDEFVCFVKATAEDGAIGWGQTATYNADITARVFHRQITPWALGQDSADIATLVARIERAEHKFPGSYRNRALAGLDTALWDMAGRRAGKPVAALIGGSAGPVRAYASSMRRDLTPDQEAERLKRICAEQGFTAAKFRIGAEMGEDRDQWEGRTEAIIPAVTRALRGLDTLVDANSGFSVPRAIAVGRMLEDNGVSHYEEPVPWWDLDATAAVAEALDIDVAGGEQEVEVTTFARMIRDRAVDLVQPDILYLGGLAKTLHVARLAA